MKRTPVSALSALSAMALIAQLLACGPETGEVVVASKAFTESVVLGEVLRLSAREQGVTVLHRRQLGGSRVLFEALKAGEIDAYVEYTGTLQHELLREQKDLTDRANLRAALARSGIEIVADLGFENTYRLGMPGALAAQLRTKRISDLRTHPTLRYALTHEVLERADGFRGLKAHYALEPRSVRGIEHALAYQALREGEVDVIDVYTTDPEILRDGVAVLDDDRHYFPEYAAIVLARADTLERQPALRRALSALDGRIDTARMRQLNAQATLEHMGETRVAAGALGIETAAATQSLRQRITARTAEHLALVGISLLAAILLAVPLGILCARSPGWARVVLGASGILQTVPSLALLVFLIPVLGIGQAPAVCALFLYSLLPIVQNTHAGLRGIPRELRESATVMGLSRGQRLRWVELPMAMPTWVAGIKTAAVINVGTATLGALVGAGGYGQPILTGIRLDSVERILEGAIPASLLALVAQLCFDRLERALTPLGMRVPP